MEAKVLFHITQVTNRSRISNRMRKYKIHPLNPVKLTLEEEIELAKSFTKVVKRHNYIIFAYNSCSDHIHFVLLCEPQNLENIVMRLKIVTSSRYKAKYNHKLWAQKFNRKPIDTVEGLSNIVNCIQCNRMKHELPESEELQIEIAKMLTSFDDYSC